jgi:hypothetical protein
MSSELMQFCGHTVRQLPHPMHLSLITYPSFLISVSASSSVPNSNDALSIGLFERSNHSPLHWHAIHPILLSLIYSTLLKPIQIFSIFMKTLIRSARSEDPYTLCLASSWQVFNQQWKAILHLSRLMISSEALASNPFNEFSFVCIFCGD